MRRRSSSKSLNAPALLLRAARLHAGFSSARAAAAAFGWSEGVYRNHEAGLRRYSERDEEKYGRAFNVGPHLHSVLDLLKIDLLHLPKAVDVMEFGHGPEPRKAERADAGLRLTVARVVAAFPTVEPACESYAWNRRTYVSHELGTNGFNERQAQAYAKAYGVTPEWLIRGTTPSGLPGAAEQFFVEHKKGLRRHLIPRNFGEWASERRRGAPTDVAGIASSYSTQDTRPIAERRLLTILDASDLAASSTLPAHSGGDRGWSVPLADLESLAPGRAKNLVGVWVDYRLVFIDPTDNAPTSGSYLVTNPGRTLIRLAEFNAGKSSTAAADDTVFGRVIAVLARIADGK